MKYQYFKSLFSLLEKKLYSHLDKLNHLWISRKQNVMMQKNNFLKKIWQKVCANPAFLNYSVVLVFCNQKNSQHNFSTFLSSKIAFKRCSENGQISSCLRRLNPKFLEPVALMHHPTAVSMFAAGFLLWSMRFWSLSGTQNETL